MSELFIEVRSEELPARFVGPAIEGLAKAITGLLKGVSFGAVTTWATPRRLAVAIADVAEGKPATEQLITGPAVAAAYKHTVKLRAKCDHKSFPGTLRRLHGEVFIALRLATPLLIVVVTIPNRLPNCIPICIPNGPPLRRRSSRRGPRHSRPPRRGMCRRG
jgi:hypothetical protein